MAHSSSGPRSSSPHPYPPTCKTLDTCMSPDSLLLLACLLRVSLLFTNHKEYTLGPWPARRSELQLSRALSDGSFPGRTRANAGNSSSLAG